MSTGNLSVASAMSMLRVIEQYTPSDFDVLGISQENFQMIHQPAPWRRENLGVVMRTMNAIIFGSLEVQGLPKLIVPSEFVAAVIASLVAPSNRMVACVWLAQERQTGVGALELAARQNSPSQYDPTSADQLFALVCLLSDTDASGHARRQFEKRLNLRISEALEGTVQ